MISSARLRLILVVTAPLMAMGAPASAQRYVPPHQTVTSHIGLMNELQKRGPYAYAHGPYAGGQYVVVGPLVGPPPDRRVKRRARHYR